MKKAGNVTLSFKDTPSQRLATFNTLFMIANPIQFRYFILY